MGNQTFRGSGIPGDFIHLNKLVKLLKGPFSPENFRGH